MKRSSVKSEQHATMEEPRGKRLKSIGDFEGNEKSSTSGVSSGRFPKIIRGQDDFLAGSIIAMELSNFMIYDHVRCKPSPRLNLVVGPNGSGKSSIVCGIALGLGGEPQQLGRASSIGAYVKRGEESGYIKIYLKTETDEPITITRKIDTRNKSEWLLNGKVVLKKDAIDIIRSFNIQVDNLTQFLPQDRVCEFAKLTPVQLLGETEKAVGDPQLPIQHRALVEKSSELKKIERAVTKMEDSLSQLKALDAEQEKDVERVRQREELLAKVESMKKKLPWLRYDMKKATYMVAKEQEKKAKNKLDEAAKTLNDLREPIDKQKQEKAMFGAKSKKLTDIINDNAKERMELLEKENRLGVQLQAKYSEMEQLRKQEESRQQRILKAKEDLVAAELELKSLPPFEPPKAELESHRRLPPLDVTFGDMGPKRRIRKAAEVGNYEEDMQERLASQILELGVLVNQKRGHKIEKEKLLAQKKGTLRQCLDRLKDMENANNKLLQALRNSGAEKIFDAYHWLQEHRHELNKEVYGPVLLEVNVSNRAHADYLEGHLPYYIWKSFITQDSGDRDTLVKNLRSCDVPILNYMGDNHHKKSLRISEEMTALGIHSRLDQVFDAPSAVKEVLTGQFGLDHSYIGSKETDQKADAVAKLGILDFWTPENHYRWATSRYGNHVSASVEAVDRSRLLFCSLDVGEIEKLRFRKTELEETVATLEENVKSLQSDQRQLEDEAAKLQKQREEIINNVHLQKRKRQEMENLVCQRKRKLESMDNEDDLDTVLAKLIEQAASCNIQRFQCVIKIKNLLIEAVSYKRSFAENHMASIEFDAKIRELEIDYKQHEKFAMEASLHFEHCKKELENCRQQLLDAKRNAESVAVITPELKDAFLEMPSTIEELEAAIQDNMGEANSILFLNHNILEEYEERQRQIQSLSTKVDTDKKELKRCLAEIDALKGSWLPTLRSLVAKINETFSRNFQEMAVAGEVLLDEHDTDFDQYGILIKVKFRQAGQLQVLSAHHQSGGERSVSTILYLVSLQDLTYCPFRVVDEINQGMDPINERKMFQQLVRAASQPNTPQCFLLTPKLLPDLKYSEACSILNIMNGPWIEQPSKLWSSGESWGTVMGLVGESRC